MKLLFFCAEDSGPTLMAEGLARHRFGQRAEVASAVVSYSQVNPHAVEAMAELGIDITRHASRSAEEIDMAEFDFVITLCAEETCRCARGKSNRVHWLIDGPAGDGPSQDPIEMRKRFGRIRDVIHARLAAFQADHLN